MAVSTRASCAATASKDSPRRSPRPGLRRRCSSASSTWSGTLRYASKADWQAITRGLKGIYTAPTVAAAEDAFLTFAETWEHKYPAMVEMWKRSWEEFISFLAFPVEIRKLIYTTNAIESINARFRAATRRRGHFPDEDAALKVLYLGIRERRPNRANPTGVITAGRTSSMS